jgi:hypothetical protein
MKIARRFTTAGQSPYAEIKFRDATSEIKNPDGSIVFKLENFQVPAHWSQVAADILAQKVFPQGWRREAAEEGRRKFGSLVAVAVGAG